MTNEIKQEMLVGIADTALLHDLHDASVKFGKWQVLDRKATTALYDVMTVAMAIGETYALDVLRLAATANNIKTQKNSTVFGIAAKLVFRGLDSATASAYSTVMEKAAAAGINPKDLPAWIISKKGIANIRKPDGPSASEARELANKQNVKKAKGFVSAPYKPMVTITSPNPALVDIKAGGSDMVLLAKFNDAGDMDVVFAYSDGDVVDLMWRKMGEAMSSKVKPRFSNVLITPTEQKPDEQSEAINAAAKTLAKAQPKSSN